MTVNRLNREKEKKRVTNGEYSNGEYSKGEREEQAGVTGQTNREYHTSKAHSVQPRFRKGSTFITIILRQKKISIDRYSLGNPGGSPPLLL